MGRLRTRFNAKARTARPASAVVGGAQEENQDVRIAAETDHYVGTNSANPLLVFPSSKRKRNRASEETEPITEAQGREKRVHVLSQLPDAPAGKVTGKKLKRLEKFVAKQLKKEEKKRLIDKLSKETFSSDLLLSSKKLGSGKLTAREKLRQALLEDRQGLPQSDPNVKLFVEKEIEVGDQSSDGEDDSDVETASNSMHFQSFVEVDHGRASGSLESAAEAHSVPPKRTIAAIAAKATAKWGGDSGQEKVDGASSVPVVFDGGFGGAMKASSAPDAANLPTGFGAALKKSGEGASAPAMLTRIQRKRKRLRENKKQKKRMTVSESEEDNEEESSEEDSEIENASDEMEVDSDDADSDELKQESATARSNWNMDVVNGEAVPNVPKSFSNTEKVAPPKPPALRKIASEKPAYHVPVERPQELQLKRLELPVVGEEQAIMETILANDVTVLCGETGSGKTTQVPQFLYEAGFGDPLHPLYAGMVGVTQPRRVAAVGMARRVSEEMGFELKVGGTPKENKNVVGYQIRYDSSTVGPRTRIKFMTDGILLRELSSTNTNEVGSENVDGEGLLLQQYSCIIIDEAHERTVGTDVLIGWLSRIVALRNRLHRAEIRKAKSGSFARIKPLKLVIMSATLRVEDFVGNDVLFPAHQGSQILKVDSNVSNRDADSNDTTSGVKVEGIVTKREGKPPVVKVDGRQFKVTIHYNRRTPDIDYVKEAFAKVSKIHTRLPHGGILVFLTGQQEIQILARKLRRVFPSQKSFNEANEDLGASEEPTQEEEDLLFREMSDDLDDVMVKRDAGIDSESDDDEGDSEDDEEEEVDVLGGMDGEGDDEDGKLGKDSASRAIGREATPLHVLPLYSALPTAAQLRVFEEPPPGTRLVVVATNIAETSLTIPGIRYVVDCGKVKERKYDAYSGAQTYSIGWTSRASADQRAGRAGRVQPGHCYRLYSSAVFNDYFSQFSEPEILRIPIEGVVLHMKAMGINHVVGFPFPTPPGRESLMSAENLLVNLGAVESVAPHRVTLLGRLLARFPVSPRHGKMLVVAAQQGNDILPYIVAVVAGLAIGDPFIRDQIHIGANSESDDEAAEKGGDSKEIAKENRAAFWKVMQLFAGDPPSSDLVRLLRAIGAYSAESLRVAKAATKASRSINIVEHLQTFCGNHFLRAKAMDEISNLRRQITRILKTAVNEGFGDGAGVQAGDSQLQVMQVNVESLAIDPRLSPPSAKQNALIRQVVLSGYPDHIAKLDVEATSFASMIARKRGTGRADTPLYSTMTSLPNTKEVFAIHNTSCMSSVRPPPQYVVYEEVVGVEERVAADNSGPMMLRKRDVNDAAGPKRFWLKGVTAIEDHWLSAIVGQEQSGANSKLISYGKVLDQPEPRFDSGLDTIVGFVKPLYSAKMWELPATEIPLSIVASRSDTGALLQFRFFAKALLEGKIHLHSTVAKNAAHRQQPKKAKNVPTEEVEGFLLLAVSLMVQQCFIS
ncbi:P-loop containing nucleoside triphosphate hydrolase protein [Cladochytrium replicatum]|nr:P-loop containing nucleoside triphosphate hydrolase protein [Cladochytrium replicatum]